MHREALANSEIGEKAVGQARAQRFPLQVPLRYRVRGERAWRRGETENISSTGVLFRGECFMDEDTSVDLCLIMPVVNSDGAAEVICRGAIVRSAPPMETEDLSEIAVKILHFRL